MMVVTNGVMNTSIQLCALDHLFDLEGRHALCRSALDVQVEDQPWPQQQFKHKDGTLTWEAERWAVG